MGYRLRGHEGERNNCFSKIQLVGQKYREQNNFSQLKLDFDPFLSPKSLRFSLLVGYNIQPSSSSTNQNIALITDHQLDFTNTIIHVFVRVKTLRNTNYVASRYITREKGSLPFDVRRSKTSLLKLHTTMQFLCLTSSQGPWMLTNYLPSRDITRTPFKSVLKKE